MSEKLTKTNQSVQKILQIIEIMTTYGPNMRIVDIAEKTNIPVSTAMRMVNTLVTYDYAKQDSINLTYSLTTKLEQIGARIREQRDISSVARPYMKTLSERCKETTTLAIEEQGYAVFIDIVDTTEHMVRVTHTRGIQVPIHCAAAGKVLLLNYSEEEIKNVFEKSEKPIYTPRTICSIDELMDDLKQTKIRGYAMNDEESELGARCFAVPLYDYSGKICAGLGISGPKFRVTDEYIKTVFPVLKDTSNKISQALGYKGEI